MNQGTAVGENLLVTAHVYILAQFLGIRLVCIPTLQVDRWPHNNYVKKLRRKDGRFYYYNKARECSEKDLPKVKLYTD